jgi:hypothetical protein
MWKAILRKVIEEVVKDILTVELGKLSAKGKQ